MLDAMLGVILEVVLEVIPGVIWGMILDVIWCCILGNIPFAMVIARAILQS